jgi:hypothetical protein
MIGHVLTDNETDLLCEILHAESERLMLKSRRTDAGDARKAIRERLRTVDRLNERLQELKAGDYSAS